MPLRPSKKPKRTLPSSRSAKPTPKANQGSPSLSRTFFLGPFLALLVLLALNSSLIDLPNLIVSTPAYLLSLVTPAPTLWELSASPKGGLGLFTTSNSSVEAGTLLLSEEPLIIRSTSSKAGNMDELNKEVKALVDKLGKKEKEWFYELMEGDGDEGGEGDLTRVQAAFLPRTRRERGIVQTNGVMVREGWMGVFRWFSRINHSCRPNALYVYRPSSNKILVHSLIPLPPNTEILVSYVVDPFLPTSARQTELLRRYNFLCTCPRCSNALVSDKRSKEVKRLKLEAAGFDLKEGEKWRIGGKEAKSKLERMLELMDLEGIRAGRGEVAEDLARVGWGIGNLYFTSHWASKASQWFGEELGKDSEEALSMGRMAMARDSSGPSTAQAERLGWQRRSVEEWEDLCG
ncbi:hypothetical protein BDY24DRAFT_286921 [Mrakia frigida]|uniref:uncharacterized protein n=1 Tax=Mrakia frigida TaxID=29902 RepID=UPI003FCC15A3